jgi:translation initiation factor IF-2
MRKKATPVTEETPPAAPEPGYEVHEMIFQPIARKKKIIQKGSQKKTEITTPNAIKRIVKMSEAITVGDLAHRMGIKAGDLIRKLISLGTMVTINQSIDYNTTVIVSKDYGFEVEKVTFEEEVLLGPEGLGAVEVKLVPKPPVVTIMGHVDHGKTSLLDAIRKTNVTQGEAGGITQHIGAYHVNVNGKSVVFLDTPGHEAFTAMRARGAKVTDIVVLVVAADDGVMPQTIEAIDHAKAAKVPVVVAVNKVDKHEANVDLVKRKLADLGIVPEEWGGENLFANVSAKNKTGIKELLEIILLQAEVLELKADPDSMASGTVIEAKMDKGMGPVATVIVQRGTLKVGDAVVAGVNYGRVRALFDDTLKKVGSAGPAMPVEIVGLSGVPQAGELFNVVKSEMDAKHVAEHREMKLREQDMLKTTKVSLEDLYDRVKEGGAKDLNLVLKADVQGSIEAIRDALMKLGTDKIKVNVIHSGVGGINESDVVLASASSAIIIGFNVRPDSKASEIADNEKVEVKLYSIIYDVADEVRKAMEGMLEPTFKEKMVGSAEVRRVFNIPKSGTIAGCHVVNGKIARSSKVRLVRDSVVVFTGLIGSLKRFKDDAREVQAGFECGIGIQNFNDLKPGDIIEAFELERIAPAI